MSDLSSELIAAYRATRFCANTPDPVEIRIGSSSPELEELLSRTGHQNWAFISAFNPGSQPLSDNDNHARHHTLIERLSAYQPHVYEGQGLPDQPDWAPETSLLVLGIYRAEAIKVGLDYGQHAIVIGRLDEPAELVFCGA